MSLVRPSFSHIFLNRRSIWATDSLPLALTLIMSVSRFLSPTCAVGSGDYSPPSSQCKANRTPPARRPWPPKRLRVLGGPPRQLHGRQGRRDVVGKVQDLVQPRHLEDALDLAVH